MEKDELITTKKPILVTSALIYSNGDMHVGHLVEYIQTDVFVRALRMMNKDVVYMGASDMHGTPIEVKAHEKGIPPYEFALKYHKKNQEVYNKYDISFDNYHSTHSDENRQLAENFFKIMKEKGLIYKKEIQTVYCPHCERNLPDRFVKGTCNNCGTDDQYSDICESCHKALTFKDLLHPRCVLCGKTPITKMTEHYFFKLSEFGDKLKKWITEHPKLQPEMKNSVMGWIDKGLEDWCISREGPYFGFKIPGEDNLYFYVWMDAPIGYISSTVNYCNKKGCNWEDYWKGDKAHIIHDIGKDITYFHFLFWPAMLMATGHNVPYEMLVHGFLTVNGKKMSKSRGTFITADEFASMYDPEYIRYYYTKILSKKLADINLDFKDFVDTINNELIGNIANFNYRIMNFTKSKYDSKIDVETDFKSFKEYVDKIDSLKEEIMNNYANWNFKDVMKKINEMSSIGNKLFQENEPWKDVEGKKEVVLLCLNIMRNLNILIKPVMPKYSARVEKQFNEKDLTIKDWNWNFKGEINFTKEILDKIETPDIFNFPANIKVAQIESVEDHPNADKLYVIKVDIGGEKRQIVAGMKPYYPKEALIGKKIVVVTNLKPAKLRGEKSEGMLLAAEDVDGKVLIIEAPKSPSGEQVMISGYKINEEQIDFKEFSNIGIKVDNKKVNWQNITLRTNQEDLEVDMVKGDVR